MDVQIEQQTLIQEFNIDQIIEDIYNKKRIEEDILSSLINKAKDIVLLESNLLRLGSPITVVGDLHGNYYNLIQIFELCGRVPDTTYLFLGNYGNRGKHALECLSLLFALKIKYPNSIYFLKGYNDCTWLMMQHNFEGQLEKKGYSNKIFKNIQSICESLSHGAVIENEIFCTSSGLSQEIQYLKDLEDIKKDKGDQNLELYYLYSSTPDEQNLGWNLFGRGEMDFGKDITKEFLEKNQLKKLVRSRCVCENGYKMLHDDKIFSFNSMPNIYRQQNLGAVLLFDEAMNPKFITYSEVKIERDEIQEMYKVKQNQDENIDINAFSFQFNFFNKDNN